MSLSLGLVIVLIVVLGYASNWLNWQFLNYRLTHALYYIGAFVHGRHIRPVPGAGGEDRDSRCFRSADIINNVSTDTEALFRPRHRWQACFPLCDKSLFAR